MAQNFDQFELPKPPEPELPFEATAGGAVLKDGEFKSPNFVHLQKGWRIDSDGNAEFQDVTIFGTTLETYFSQPWMPVDGGATADIFMGSNTTAYFFQFTLPAAMIVNSISFVEFEGTDAGASSFDLAVYSEDGQNKHFEVTTASFPATLNGSQLCETAVDSVRLLAGNYYLGLVLNSNVAQIGYRGHNATQVIWEALNGFDSSNPKISGTKTVTAGTLPTTFNPVSDLTELSFTQGGFLPFRLDN